MCLYCPFGSLLRNTRHHTIHGLIAKAFCDNGWEVFEEVNCLAENGSTRRIDILAIDKQRDRSVILDPTVHLESGEQQPHDVHSEKQVWFSKGMEEPVFVKCEPPWSSDIKEEPSNFEQSAVPFSDNQVNVMEDPCAEVADPSSEQVDINLVKESCSDEDETGEAHHEECENSGGPSHDVECAVLLTGTAMHSCDSSNKTFGKRSEQMHHLAPRTENNSKLFHCSICGKSFERASHLKKHSNIHNESRPFPCPICGRTFRISYNLTDHLKRHSDIKPFSCSICGNTFKSSSNLKNHSYKHTNSRPYTCSICGHSFKSPSDLRNHQNTHSDIRPFSCSICGNSFKRATYLRYHERTHTGKKTAYL